MKGRSHRLPPTAPPDDWGDGSWTVDCSCGVTFDDGEEMVSCDQCGVWVHTRCARFVRGDPSFACHNCKSTPLRHDTSEETEVAQLLAELPTKAAESPLPPLPLRRPHIPIEHRVHVHGIPGGDPALFQNASPVFSPHLWKCAGYVPKKFNFPYREFPFLGDEEEEENPASKGAGVLFSLSKETVVPSFPAIPMLANKPSQEVAKKMDAEKPALGSRSQGSSKKEKSRIRMSGASSGKRRKDDHGEGKRRARDDHDRTSTDTKKRGSFPIVDMNKAGLYDEGPHVADSDVLDVKGEERMEDGHPKPKFTEEDEGTKTGSKPAHVFVIKASRGGLSDDASRKRCLLETSMKAEKADHPEHVVSRGEGSHVAKEPVVNEDVNKAQHGLKQPKDENHFHRVLNGSSCDVVIENSKPAINNLSLDGEETNTSMIPYIADAISVNSKAEKTEIKLEEAGDEKLNGMDHLSQHLKKPSIHSSRNLPDNESDMTLPSAEEKSQEAQRNSEATHQTCNKIIECKLSRFSDPKLNGHVIESAGSSTLQKVLLEPRYGSKYLEPTKSGSSYQSPTTTNVCKLVVGFGKAPSASALSGPSVPGSNKSLGDASSSTVEKAVHLTKQHLVKVTHEGDNVTAAESGEESIPEVSRQTENNHSKDSEFSGSKSSRVSRDSYVSSKHTQSDSKEQLISPLPKAFRADNSAKLSSSSEATESLQAQKDSAHIKQISSGPCQKNEKINQPVSQLSMRASSHSVAMHPPAAVNTTPALSDQELAMLLHQELNSSPRVPRVPRVRQAAGMQLAAPTATSMLKRSSSYGGKDQVSISRRKSKEDASRDSSRNSRDLIDESKRVGRMLSSPDHKHQESTSTTDGSAKKDSWNRSPDAAMHVKKNLPVGLIETTNSCPPSFEVSVQKGSSTRSSPKDVPHDVGTLTRRTLPGLIDEILSKGKRMTYEELCEAVRPHWLNLRKPNGERYAYASHQHAVLDCLRNRNEWAHLIDRGPKTNSSKRRRKPDSDTPSVDSENEETRNAPWEAEDRNRESHRDDYPKGKRNARKRRRLELRGKGMRETRKSFNQNAVSDDDPAALSHSSNDVIEGNFSEDESQGAGQLAIGDGISSCSSDGAD